MREIKRIINHFLDDDLYKITMCLAVLVNFPKAWVIYEFVDRAKLIYPKGFADEVNRQIKMLEDVVITEQEIAYMKLRCYFLPEWFYTFLRGFRYNSKFWGLYNKKCKIQMGSSFWGRMGSIYNQNCWKHIIPFSAIFISRFIRFRILGV